MTSYRVLERAIITSLGLLMACSMMSSVVCAQSAVTATWANSSGNWTNSANWSCSPSPARCVPNNGGGNSFNVSFSSPGNTVTLDKASSPSSIAIDALTLSDGTLAIGQTGALNVINALSMGNAAAVQVAPGATLQTGLLRNLDFFGNLVGGTYKIAGNFLFPGIITVIASDTSLTIEGSSAVFGRSGLVFADTLGNEGTFALNGHPLTIGTQLLNGGQLKLNNSSSLTIGPENTLGGYINSVGGGSVPAVIDIEGGSTIKVFGGIGNSRSSIILGATKGGNTLLVSTNVTLDPGGTLVEEGDGDHVSAGGFNNNGGGASIGTGASVTVTGGGYGGLYSQTAGTTDVNGTLIAPTVDISSGKLSGTGSITSAVDIGVGATLSPGDAPGTLHIDGPLTLGGTLIESIDSSSSFSALDVTRELTLGPDSVLSVLLAPGFDPTVGTTFTILDFASLSPGSQFGSVVNQFFNDHSEEWSIAYNSRDIVLTAESATASSTPEPASLLLLCTGLGGVVWLARRRCVVRKFN